jgi:hypothetical protein
MIILNKFLISLVFLSFLITLKDVAASTLSDIQNGIYEAADGSCDIELHREKEKIEFSYRRHVSRKDPMPCNGTPFISNFQCGLSAQTCMIKAQRGFNDRIMTIQDKTQFSLKTKSDDSLIYKYAY